MFDFAAARGSGDDEKEPMTTMGFLDHLEELRKRLVHSIVAVAVGFGVCWWKAEWLFGFAQRPIVDVLRKHGLPEKLVFLNPTDPFNLYLKVAALAGLFLTSPYVLYQVWMFISPGLYRNEKRYVVPFMVSTITLFVSGGYFGYRIVYPRALDFLIGFGRQFQPMITITEYTQLFLSIILGMGLIFEMPILVFFLAFMGIMSPEFMIKNFRYSILVIFIIAAIVTPTPDIVNMCVFAAPMLILYALSIGVAWLVHPKQRSAREEKQKAKQGGKQAQ
jgi:sec-independent protein translocase protein TatC